MDELLGTIRQEVGGGGGGDDDDGGLIRGNNNRRTHRYFYNQRNNNAGNTNDDREAKEAEQAEAEDDCGNLRFSDHLRQQMLHPTAAAASGGEQAIDVDNTNRSLTSTSSGGTTATRNSVQSNVSNHHNYQYHHYQTTPNRYQRNSNNSTSGGDSNNFSNYQRFKRNNYSSFASTSTSSSNTSTLSYSNPYASSASSFVNETKTTPQQFYMQHLPKSIWNSPTAIHPPMIPKTFAKPKGSEDFNNTNYNNNFYHYKPNNRTPTNIATTTAATATTSTNTSTNVMIQPAFRDVKDILVHDYQGRFTYKETMYLMQKNSPDVAYRQLEYPPSVTLEKTELIFCLTLPKHPSSSGYQEPMPNDQPGHLVMVKQIPKGHGGFGSGFHNNNNNNNYQPYGQQQSTFQSTAGGYYGGGGGGILTYAQTDVDGAYKDATLLKHLGDVYSGIVECIEILEDKDFIYIVCDYDPYQSLTDVSIPAPIHRNDNVTVDNIYDNIYSTNTRHHGSNTDQSLGYVSEADENRIKVIFRDLVLAVQSAHKHGICCCRGLCPETIMVPYQERGINERKNKFHRRRYQHQQQQQNTNDSYNTKALKSRNSTHHNRHKQKHNTDDSRALLFDFSRSLWIHTSDNTDPTSPSTLSTTPSPKTSPSTSSPTTTNYQRQQQQRRRHLIRKHGIIPLLHRKRYMAPEVFHTQVQVFDGYAADMWTLGVILFNLLTGCEFYSTPSQLDPMYRHYICHDGFMRDEIIDELMQYLFINTDNDVTVPTEGATRTIISNFALSISAVNTLSNPARHLLSSLLQENPTKRLTTERVLTHRWLSSARLRS